METIKIPTNLTLALAGIKRLHSIVQKLTCGWNNTNRHKNNKIDRARDKNNAEKKSVIRTMVYWGYNAGDWNAAAHSSAASYLPGHTLREGASQSDGAKTQAHATTHSHSRRMQKGHRASTLVELWVGERKGKSKRKEKSRQKGEIERRTRSRGWFWERRTGHSRLLASHKGAEA